MIRPLIALLAVGLLAQTPQKDRVSSNLTPTGFFLKPIGQSLTIPNRPVDIALHPNGKWLYAKENSGLTVVDLATWQVVQQISVPGGASYTGLLLSPEGDKIWFSNAASMVQE